MGRLISIHPQTVYLVQDETIDLIALATALPDDTAITLYRGVWNTDDTPPYRVTLGEIRAWCAAGKPMPALAALGKPAFRCPDCGGVLQYGPGTPPEPPYCETCDREPDLEANATANAAPTRDEINARMDRLREEKYRR